MGEVIAGLMVVGSETVAGDGLRDDALAGEGEIVRALEEVLGGMRVGGERGSVFGESWAEVAALPSGEPELIGTDGGVWLADHLKLQIGNDGGKRQGWVREEVLITLASGFFTAEADEENAPARAAGERGESASQFKDGGGAAGIVIGSVIDDLAGGSAARAKVIEVGAEQDGFGGKCGIGAAEQAGGVVGEGAGRGVRGGARGSVRGKPGFERNALDLGGLQAEGLELRGDIGGGDKFIVGGTAASAKGVSGEERHFAMDMVGDVGVVLGVEQSGGEQDEADEDAGAEHNHCRGESWKLDKLSRIRIACLLLAM